MITNQAIHKERMLKETARKASDNMRVMHGTMSRDQFQQKYKEGKYNPTQK